MRQILFTANYGFLYLATAIALWTVIVDIPLEC